MPHADYQDLHTKTLMFVLDQSDDSEPPDSSLAHWCLSDCSDVLFHRRCVPLVAVLSQTCCLVLAESHGLGSASRYVVFAMSFSIRSEIDGKNCRYT